MNKSKVNIGDKVSCYRRDDTRFKHPIVGLVKKKYDQSALLIIMSSHIDDDESLVDSKGVTIFPYKDMKKIEEE